MLSILSYLNFNSTNCLINIMRKPQCTVVHEDFRSKHNVEISLVSRPPLFSATPPKSSSYRRGGLTGDFVPDKGNSLKFISSNSCYLTLTGAMRAQPSGVTRVRSTAICMPTEGMPSPLTFVVSTMPTAQVYLPEGTPSRLNVYS